MMNQAMMTVKNWSQNAGSTSTSIGRPAIHPAMVDLKGKTAFETEHREIIEGRSVQKSRTPSVQFGPGADAKAVSLCVEDQDYMGHIKKLLQEYLDQVRRIVKPGCSQDVLKAPLSVMAPVTDVLTTISSSSNDMVNKLLRTSKKSPTNSLESFNVLCFVFSLFFFQYISTI